MSISENAIIVAMNDDAFVVVTAGDDNNVNHLIRLCVPLHANGATSREGKQETETNAMNCNQIQAVAITDSSNGDTIYCAVSRYDKSLSIYSLSKDTLATKEAVEEATPFMVHKTNKRCCALLFAKIAPPKIESNGQGLDVIVTADLAGDVYAFSLEEEGSKNGPSKKLLLGHTASMLTSCKIVHDKIFTADRDEKVRVSSFPQTFEVLGYLLGNESYVTDIDAKQEKYCVTVSGDCTMRLWDYNTYQEILCIHLSREFDSETCGTFVDGQGPKGPQKDVSCIPVRVAFNPQGDLIAVIYNKKDHVDIFSIDESESSVFRVVKKQSIECMKPLGIAFFHNDLIALTNEPNYFMSFRKNADGEFVDQGQNCKLVGSIRGVGEKNAISMPESVLETDGATGKIKLERDMTDEREGFVEHKPWLEGKRVQSKREKEKRRKKRRFEELANQKVEKIDD